MDSGDGESTLSTESSEGLFLEPNNSMAPVSKLEELNSAESSSYESVLSIPVYSGLEKHESHMNWISAKDKIRIGNIDTMIGLITDRIHSKGLEERYSMLKYVGLEFVSLRITLAFCYALLDEDIQAQYHLIIASDDIQHMKENNYADEDYLTGLRHVLKGVNIFNFLQKRRVDLSVSFLPAHEIDPFITDDADLCKTPKTKAVILAARHFFDVLRNECQNRSSGEQIQLLEQIIELDPNYYLWHLHLYNLHRRCRQERKDPCLNSSSLEIQEILKAVELAPDDPVVVIYECVSVAELKTRESWRNPVRYGYREFKSTKDVNSFIKSQTNKLLEIHHGSLPVSICVADCYLSRLPQKYFANADCAKECITNALTNHPNSSKAHYWMGKYFLLQSWKDRESLKEAAKYFALAVEFDRKNYAALISLLKVYMSDPVTNYSNIQTLVERGLDCKDFCVSHRASILFWNGCFLLLTVDDHRPDNDILAAIEWMKAYELHTDSIKFDQIFNNLKKFNWPKRKLVPGLVFATVVKLIKSGKVDTESRSLAKLKLIARKYRDEEASRYNSHGNRDSDWGGRGNHGTDAGSRGNGHFVNRRNNADPTGGSNAAFPNLSNYERGRPRRFSSSATANGSVSAQRVTIVREPIPPHGGRGFSHHRHPINHFKTNSHATNNHNQ